MTDNVTRFEVVDYTTGGAGRILVRYGVKVDTSLEDSGRTLKVFLRDGEPFVHDMREWNSE